MTPKIDTIFKNNGLHKILFRSAIKISNIYLYFN